ncbi:MAG: hypothetical protein U9Q03_00825 [Patescibacteria group bacterium]|nr:hypothetical protein [Patescibacteria group bacterium]
MPKIEQDPKTEPRENGPESESDTRLDDQINNIMENTGGMTFRTDRKYGISDGKLNKIEHEIDGLELGTDEREAVLARVKQMLIEQRDRMAFRETLTNAALETEEGVDRTRHEIEANGAIGLDVDDSDIEEVRLEREENEPSTKKQRGWLGRLASKILGKKD